MPTQSVLTHEIDADGDDDMTLEKHVAKSIDIGKGGDGSPQGSLKRVDSAEKTTEDAMVKQPVSFSQRSNKVSEEAKAGLMTMMALQLDE